VKVLRTALFAAFAAALAVVPAGCGGGGSSETTTTTTTSSTTTSAGNVRLTQESWAKYEQIEAGAKSVNDAAIAKFRTCRKLVATNASAQQVNACFGPPTASVVAHGQKVLRDLASIGQDVGGACAAATAHLHDSITLYISSVNKLNLSAQNGTVPSTDDVDAAVRTLTASRAADAQFEQACKPQ
jgi:hypothetical protein